MLVQVDGETGFGTEDFIPVSIDVLHAHRGYPAECTKLFTSDVGDLLLRSSYGGRLSKSEVTIDLPYEAVMWALNRASRAGAFYLSLTQKDLPGIKAEYKEYLARRSTVSNSSAHRPEP